MDFFISWCRIGTVESFHWPPATLAKAAGHYLAPNKRSSSQSAPVRAISTGLNRKRSQMIQAPVLNRYSLTCRGLTHLSIDQFPMCGREIEVKFFSCGFLILLIWKHPSVGGGDINVGFLNVLFVVDRGRKFTISSFILLISKLSIS